MVSQIIKQHSCGLLLRYSFNANARIVKVHAGMFSNVLSRQLQRIGNSHNANFCDTLHVELNYCVVK